MQTQGDWLPARAALHPTGLYFALRDIRAAELQDPFMQETIARVPARESVVQVARGDVGKGTAGTAPGTTVSGACAAAVLMTDCAVGS